MKRLIFIIILISLLNCSYAQESSYNSFAINNSGSDPISSIGDMVFLNSNTGYVMAMNFGSYPNPNIFLLFKTINGGQNWSKIYSSSTAYGSGRASFSINNNGIGYIFIQNEGRYLWKTEDGGQSFSQIPVNYPGFPYTNYQNILCVNANGFVFKLSKTGNAVSVVDHPLNLNPLIKYFASDISLNHIEVSKTTNTVYVCGRKGINPFLAKSTDNGRTYTTILDGNTNPSDIGELYHMTIYYEGNNEILRISGYNKLAEYRNSFNVYNYN